MKIAKNNNKERKPNVAKIEKKRQWVENSIITEKHFR